MSLLRTSRFSISHKTFTFLFTKLIKSIQVGWKSLILDFMERYFYLICFAAYALEHGPNNYQKSFKSWMDDHNELRQFNDFIKQLIVSSGTLVPK